MEVYFPRTAVKQSDLEKQAPDPTPLLSHSFSRACITATHANAAAPSSRRYMGQSDGKFTIGLGYVFGFAVRGVCATCVVRCGGIVTALLRSAWSRPTIFS